MTNQSIKQNGLNVKKLKLQDNKELTPTTTHKENEITINMTREAFDKTMFAICPPPAESGGLLLGEIGSDDVCDFFFDSGGNFTRSSYSPDYINLDKKMKEEWMPAGIDMKGIVHSHPGRLDVLTNEDLEYIQRLLKANSDMSMFIAPIIIPPEFRMRAYVVFRDNPGTAVEARINFF